MKLRDIATVSDCSNRAAIAQLPYGEPWSEPGGQPMLFGGKERESRSKNSLYGPRQYSAAAMRWWAPDLKAGDYTPQSPYTFCASNPILFTDPTGMDIYTFDNMGNFTRTEDPEKDQIVVQKGENNPTLDLPPGTVLSATDIPKNSTESMSVFKIRGDKNSDEIFEFLADNTNVEYSLIKCGEEGDKGLNFLSSYHNEDSDSSFYDLINGQLIFGYTLRTFTHNHPSGRFRISKNDKNTATVLSRYFPNLRYFLYVSDGKKYTEYDKNTPLKTDLSPIEK